MLNMVPVSFPLDFKNYITADINILQPYEIFGGRAPLNFYLSNTDKMIKDFETLEEDK
jgi:hypothetical protein